MKNIAFSPDWPLVAGIWEFKLPFLAPFNGASHVGMLIAINGAQLNTDTSLMERIVHAKEYKSRLPSMSKYSFYKWIIMLIVK